jgi:hypothetical protein
MLEKSQTTSARFIIEAGPKQFIYLYPNMVKSTLLVPGPECISNPK